jgi:hypothetical protein
VIIVLKRDPDGQQSLRLDIKTGWQALLFELEMYYRGIDALRKFSGHRPATTRIGLRRLPVELPVPVTYVLNII